ncbi:heme peroxidase [Cynara cardunculus var. scolymus]|uniref:peroxidase n=1 Tax=Cynara cardunculus var. scolymus TaxID=59895 RepID=A0A118JUR1_CYNCS|nr:heme peroxidase [Cynara cardunculus var. scolymus]
MDHIITLFLVFVTLLQTKPILCNNEPLIVGYYEESCPFLEEIVRRQVEIAVLQEPRMAASLLRLHFHDCTESEKKAAPNTNSLRGFEVIDEIKNVVEDACPCTVSCADLLAIVARDAVALTGGPKWNVYLGRRDSMKASLDDANKFIPTPNSSLETLIANFGSQGLNAQDLVVLSGLLVSDNVLVAEDVEREIRDVVWAFASNEEHFFTSFANSMIKMGNIRVLTGQQGEIRKNCRLINT